MFAIVAKVVCSFLFWLFFYIALRSRNKNRTPEWGVRLITLMHGLIITFLSGYITFIDGPWPLTHPGHPNTPLQITVLCLSLGYFFFDFGWCTYFNSEDELMIYHHILCIFGMGGVLVMGVSGSEINALIFLAEITNPLLQIRWFLRDMGHYEGIAGEVVDGLFVFLFLGLRLGGGVWIVHAVLTSPKPNWEVKAGVLLMYFVSIVFAWDILKFVKRKLMKKYEACRKERTERERTKSNGHQSNHYTQPTNGVL
nr:TLC domain-containing protein 5-like [Anolis sagrei ordinatus]